MLGDRRVSAPQVWPGTPDTNAYHAALSYPGRATLAARAVNHRTMCDRQTDLTQADAPADARALRGRRTGQAVRRARSVDMRVRTRQGAALRAPVRGRHISRKARCRKACQSKGFRVGQTFSSSLGCASAVG